MKTMLKKLIFSLLFSAMAFAFVSCEKSSSDDYYWSEDDWYNDFSSYDETGLFVGITGFNSDLEHYYVHILDKYTSSGFEQFIQTLETNNGTLLYYAVDNTISQLAKSKFPDDLKNVSIITFTDGLDQGSSAKNTNYQSASAYLEAIQKRIRSTKINGLNINAYSIGLKGQDVKDEVQFKSNLKGLASSDENSMEVASIDEVNDKFMQLAASLYNKNTNQALTLTIPQPYNNTKIRFTFDIETDNAANSACYIEGVFRDGSLTQAQYKGISSSSGNIIKGESYGSINISFTFDNLAFEAGNELTISRIKQWEWVENSSLWQVNSEFDPNKSTETIVEMQSAVIILLLDCSSSLGSDFEKVKQTAQNFIKALSGASDGNMSQTAQVRFRKDDSYTNVSHLAIFNLQEELLAGCNFGTNSGTSTYTEIPTGYHYPLYYYVPDNGYQYIIRNEPYTYYFAGGKKYTVISSDDGQYLTFDVQCDN
ncbi:MAG: VWA domain-containing protein [Alistipes senegalensis]|nr:VWA domain-containing protein [Bacteroides cellulosilyticus]MCM1351498.1 VWA domain-containing protein [Alistipes senegalensis]